MLPHSARGCNLTKHESSNGHPSHQQRRLPYSCPTPTDAVTRLQAAAERPMTCSVTKSSSNLGVGISKPSSGSGSPAGSKLGCGSTKPSGGSRSRAGSTFALPDWANTASAPPPRPKPLTLGINQKASMSSRLEGPLLPKRRTAQQLKTICQEALDWFESRSISEATLRQAQVFTEVSCVQAVYMRACMGGVAGVGVCVTCPLTLHPSAALAISSPTLSLRLLNLHRCSRAASGRLHLWQHYTPGPLGAPLCLRVTLPPWHPPVQ